MKYLVLIWAGLWRKPVRTVLTALSVATAFLLYGGLHGTMVSFDEVLAAITDDSVLWTASRVNMRAGLPMAHLQRIEQVDGVQAVDIEQGFGGHYAPADDDIGGRAIDVDRLRANPIERFVVSEAALDAMQRMRTGTIVGRALADAYGWKIGDRLPLTSGPLRKDGSNEWVFDVVGIWDVAENSQFDADQIWINYDYLDEARALGNGMVMGFSTRVADPSQATRIAAEIDALFANSPNETLTRSMGDMIRAEIDQVTDIRLIIDVVLSAVLFTLLFLTGNTMMQSTVERIPELAVLKTYGFGDAAVAGLVLVESALLCVVSALVGIGLAKALLYPMIAAGFRIDPLPMEESVVLTGIAIAVALAGLSALPPAWRARRLNVVDALAGR